MNKDLKTSTIIIYSTYTFLVYAFGLTVRFFSQGELYSAFVQSMIYDNIFVPFLFLNCYIIKKMKMDFSPFSIILIVATGIVSGFFFLFLFSYVFPVHLDSIIPKPKKPFPVVTVVAYFALLTIIWNITYLWIQNIYIYHEREMLAVRAQNAAENAALFSEVRRLRQQIDPNLLFNVLNSTMVEVTQDPKKATLLVRELISYLRYSLDHAEIDFVAVSVEIGMIRSYLRLLDIRFGANIKSQIKVDIDARDRLIPTFLLQPLIENASRYGIADEKNSVNIRINIATQDDQLVVEVANTGSLDMVNSKTEADLSGISNLRARLLMHYPDRHSFEMTQLGNEIRTVCRLVGEPR